LDCQIDLLNQVKGWFSEGTLQPPLLDPVANFCLPYMHGCSKTVHRKQITPEFPHPDSQTPAELPHRRRASTNLAGDGLHWIGYQEFTHLINLLVGPGASPGLLLRASVDEHKAVPPGSS
jgi:hypothetical protein